MPYKFHKHLSVYLKEALFKQISDLAVAEKKSINGIINDLIRIGIAKRQEEILGLEKIAHTIKADLQLMRDEIKKQSNRSSSLLAKFGLHTIATRYQITHIHAKIADNNTAKKIADMGWKYAIEKLKAKEASDIDSEK